MDRDIDDEMNDTSMKDELTNVNPNRNKCEIKYQMEDLLMLSMIRQALTFQCVRWEFRRLSKI